MTAEALRLLAMLLFLLAASTLLMRRNLLVQAMAMLLFFLAAGLMLATSERGDAHGTALVILCAATAELILALALIVALFRRKRRVDVDALKELGS